MPTYRQAHSNASSAWVRKSSSLRTWLGTTACFQKLSGASSSLKRTTASHTPHRMQGQALQQVRRPCLTTRKTKAITRAGTRTSSSILSQKYTTSIWAGASTLSAPACSKLWSQSSRCSTWETSATRASRCRRTTFWEAWSASLKEVTTWLSSGASSLRWSTWSATTQMSSKSCVRWKDRSHLRLNGSSTTTQSSNSWRKTGLESWNCA